MRTKVPSARCTGSGETVQASTCGVAAWGGVLAVTNGRGVLRATPGARCCGTPVGEQANSPLARWVHLADGTGWMARRQHTSTGGRDHKSTARACPHISTLDGVHCRR